MTKNQTGWRATPRTVWALGVVSMLMDASSEIIHALLPIFLVGTLGASASLVGLIEGIAEATASVTKIFSGWISDRLGKRKLPALIGYGLGALSKPLFPLAGTAGFLLGARFIDRVGKGIRGAPRDALIADVTPPALRGTAYGLRQALDTVGAIAGPLMAVGLMALFANDLRKVMWWAAIPAVLAVLTLWLFVREPEREDMERSGGPPLRLSAARRLSRGFWVVIGVAVVFHLARFSEAFLILKASHEGLALGLTPMVLVVMSIVYAVVSTPAGELSDRIGRRTVLAFGLAALVAADLVLALTSGVTGALVGTALWGLHMGLSQGLLSALVADHAPRALRGTAFGVFGLATGAAVLAASVLAGGLWDAIGPNATFGAGAVFSGLAFAGLWLVDTKTPASAAGEIEASKGEEA
ncbi:MAG TPA: MFS transporter [Caulobacteraceae bacterium]